ncbi:MAG: hypothetical protein HY897_15705 [Deltaproteobacteria bacterium]|nr:hypothetical protein [Deltaproteobacteria bacterium]
MNDNNLWITTMDQDGQWASEEIPVGVLASQTYDPALVNYRGDLFVMYHDGTNALWQKQMSPEGEWGDAVPVTDGTGQQMKSCNSPALATRGLFKGGPSNWVDVSILHLVTAASASDDCSAQSHRFDTRYLDDTTGRWHEGVRLMPDETYTNVDWSEQKVYGTGKVGFAWQADGSISTGGRFYLFYRGKDDEPQYQFMTWEQGGWEWGMTGSLPGGLVNTGADITFHGGQGLFNIVGVYAMPTYPSVAFVPYVDGICNYQLRDWNDWQSISSRICRAIVRPAFGEQFDLNYCGP